LTNVFFFDIIQYIVFLYIVYKGYAMYNYNHINKKRVAFSLFFLIISILLFIAITFNPKIHSGKDASIAIDNVPFVSAIVLLTQNIIYNFYLGFGIAIHFLYIILFLWAITMWDNRCPFPIIQRGIGIFLLLLSISTFSQAYFLFWDGKLAKGNSVGYSIVSDILVPHLGVFPSFITSFMFIIAGTILSLDWIFIFFLWLVFYSFIYFLNLVKRLFILTKHGIEWINTNIISLEQYTLVTEPSSIQLQLPLSSGNEDYPNFQAKVNTDTSCLPDLPLTEVEQEVPEMFSQSASTVSTPPKNVMGSNNRLNNETIIPDLKIGKDSTKDVKEKKGSFWNLYGKENKELTKNIPTVSCISSEEPIRSGRPSQHKSNKIQAVITAPEYPWQYTKPPLSLLDEPVPFEIPNYNEQLQERAEILIKTLERFGVKARVTGITHGPTITRYELEPEPGIKVTRFLSHADDITLALKADRVRVEAPIPGRGKVGIEVPNPVREQVLLRELIESYALTKHRGRLRLPLGKDITGEVKVVDLTQMPHLLIAGATGSGKTVFVKALLASLLFQYTPDELRLVLIDPKMVEFSIFNDIPHLLEPVVTDAKKAGEALDILVKEMERRYTLFANTNTRNLEIYNQNVENGQLEIYEEGDRDLFSTPIKVVRKLPHIVCIIDELADLMMLQRNAVESAIARLSQLARAVGIHLIVATQRPSVDVITGVIKANFPARISFQVSSKIDSRCILDTIGAEKLIGHGDMLYHNAGLPKPMRIQGAFVSDEEIEALVNYLKSQAPPQYLNCIGFDNSKKKEAESSFDDDDPLFEEAVRIVRETKQASVSLLQRRLRIGYARAGHLIDMMELRGIVGPHRGSKPREILHMSSDNEDEIERQTDYNNEEINPSDEEDNEYG